MKEEKILIFYRGEPIIPKVQEYIKDKGREQESNTFQKQIQCSIKEMQSFLAVSLFSFHTGSIKSRKLRSGISAFAAYNLNGRGLRPAQFTSEYIHKEFLASTITRRHLSMPYRI